MKPAKPVAKGDGSRKLSKRMGEAVGKIDQQKIYTVAEAIPLARETSKVKFDASVELHVNLGIDVKKSDQSVRASVSLPHGTGKKVRVAAFVPADKVAAAKAAGADIAGESEFIDEIKTTGKCDFDVAVATPDMMKPLAAIARILGTKGLMPNPRTGTIAPDVTKLIGELKAGKVSFKNDASGVVHVACGKTSFTDEQLLKNIEAILDAIKKAKPQTMKGNFIKTAYLSSTMGPSVRVAVA